MIVDVIKILKSNKFDKNRTFQRHHIANLQKYITNRYNIDRQK